MLMTRIIQAVIGLGFPAFVILLWLGSFIFGIVTKRLKSRIYSVEEVRKPEGNYLYKEDELNIARIRDKSVR